MLIAPGGKVLYEKAGKIDILDIRRIILANMPDTASAIGQQAYWTSVVTAATRARQRKSLGGV